LCDTISKTGAFVLIGFVAALCLAGDKGFRTQKTNRLNNNCSYNLHFLIKIEDESIIILLNENNSSNCFLETRGIVPELAEHKS
jgi:hypothetical protein